MIWAWLNEHFGACTPNHHKTINFLFVTEAIDVGTDAVQHGALTDFTHGVFASEIACVLALERSLHWANLTQCLCNCFNVLALFKNTGT